MALLEARWISKDSNTLRESGTQLQVFLNSGGALEADSAGINVKTGGITNAMLAGSIADGKLAESYIYANGSRAFTGNQSMGGHRLTDGAAGVNDTDFIIKSQLDNAVNGLDWHESVKVYSDSNITLSGSQTIDGISVTDGDRVLATNQSNSTEDGIWVVNTSGSWTRADDAQVGDHFRSAAVFVEEGNTYADSGWVCTNDSGSDVIGTDNLTFVQFTGAGMITAGDGLSKSGNTLSVTVSDLAGFGLENDGSNNLRVASTMAGQGLSGGSGSAFDINTGNGIQISSDAVALGTLTSDWDVGGSHTITNVPDPVNNTDVANKQWVLAQTGAINTRIVNHFTLSSTDIANKYVTLSGSPSIANATVLHVKSAPAQNYGDDYTVSGQQLSWSGLGLDGVLVAGDKLTVVWT